MWPRASALAVAAIAAAAVLGFLAVAHGETEERPAPAAAQLGTAAASTAPPPAATRAKAKAKARAKAKAKAKANANAVAVQPMRVRIPAIGVDASVTDLGLNADGTLEVPTDYAKTGWYTGRSAPGERGPSVVVGHVDSTTGPAVFHRLGELEAGDLIAIDRSDGLVAWFRAREVALVDKDRFPTNRVYGSRAQPVLRLITCGGDFDHSASSYLGNLIVYAAHLGNVPPGQRVPAS